VRQNLWQKKGGQLGGSQTLVAPLYVDNMTLILLFFHSGSMRE
jgi:hypothetical protein